MVLSPFTLLYKHVHHQSPERERNLTFRKISPFTKNTFFQYYSYWEEIISSGPKYFKVRSREGFPPPRLQSALDARDRKPFWSDHYPAPSLNGKSYSLALEISEYFKGNMHSLPFHQYWQLITILCWPWQAALEGRFSHEILMGKEMEQRHQLWG